MYRITYHPRHEGYIAIIDDDGTILAATNNVDKDIADVLDQVCNVYGKSEVRVLGPGIDFHV